MRALIGNEPAYRLGLDRREINAAVAELLQEETSDDAPIETPRRRCQTAHLVHVRIETTQLLVDRRRFQHPLRDHGIGSQDHQEMTECGPKILARVHDRSRTPAMRQVLVEKLRDDLFVKVLRVQSALAHPPAKVNKAAEVVLPGSTAHSRGRRDIPRRYPHRAPAEWIAAGRVDFQKAVGSQSSRSPEVTDNYFRKPENYVKFPRGNSRLRSATARHSPNAPYRTSHSLDLHIDAAM